MKFKFRFLLVVLVCDFFIQVRSNWWSLATIQPGSFKSTRLSRRLCYHIPGFTHLQRKVCKQRPDLMRAVSRGARLAVKSCRKVFVNHRWNCSLVERSPSLFGKLTKKSHRETAFLYALFTAALVHSVTKACSKGQINNCYCHKRRGRRNRITWSSNAWMGCNEDLRDGVAFSKLFLEKSESTNRNSRSLMNIHNIKVGRRVVKGLMKEECKCHGVSGSCVMQTCKKSLKDFHIAARILKNKYDSARMVSFHKKEVSSRKIFPRGVKRSTKTDLVYLQHSPDYCSPNPKLDIIGTGKRICQLDVLALNSCEVTCCGRGYDTSVKLIHYRCQCKFKWCCKVNCRTCKGILEEYTCKS